MYKQFNKQFNINNLKQVNIMKNSVNNSVFMAFAAGKESTEGSVIKRYIGVAPVTVLGVNPTKAELEKIYDREIENEPTYLGEQDGVKNVRIDFIVKTFADKCNGIDMTTKVTFFVRNEARVNRDKTKCQVIDKYGRTAWVTEAQLKDHEIPMYTNGPANLDKDYRPCFVGEEDLTHFIINYLNIPSVMSYRNNAWVMVEHPEECEARLDGIAEYFKGNFKELNEIIKLQPNNKVKVLFGVRTADNGSQYQTAYTQMTLKNGVSDYSRLEKDLNDRKAAGAYSTTEFKVCELKEYTVEATTLDKPAEVESPFLNSAVDANPFF